MRKIPTLFKREIINNKKIVLDEINEDCEWVLSGEGVATRKLDGTCCLIQDNKIFARFDAKPGRNIPDGAIPCQKEPDLITGHFPHWVEVKNQPQYKWHKLAFEKLKKSGNFTDGTYELIGKHFMNNPECVEDGDILVSHDSELLVLGNVPRDFKGLFNYLRDTYMEGIVFHRDNGDMCKIKRTDFGLEWNGSDKKRKN